MTMKKKKAETKENIWERGVQVILRSAFHSPKRERHSFHLINKEGEGSEGPSESLKELSTEASDSRE